MKNNNFADNKHLEKLGAAGKTELLCPECGWATTIKNIDFKTIIVMHRMQRMSGFESIKANLDSEDRTYFCPVCGEGSIAKEWEVA